MTGLINGSTIVIKRQGSSTESGWLRGLLGRRLLGFAPSTLEYKDSHWKVHHVEKDIYRFENLGASTGDSQEFWLDAEFRASGVKLAGDKGNSTSGTYWRVQQGNDGSFTFEGLGSNDTSRKFWLGWMKVGSSTLTDFSVGLTDQAMSWQLFRISEPGVALRSGEVELRTAKGETRLLTMDWANLTKLAVPAEFTQLRVGPNTGVTLFANENFQSTSQNVIATISDLKSTRLAAIPKSLKIWSTVGTPFTGKWAIKAPNGQYLSQAQEVINTVNDPKATELFSIQSIAPASNNQQQVKIVGSQGEAFTKDFVSIKGQTLTLVEEGLTDRRKFSLKAGSKGWINFQPIKLSGNLMVGLRALNGRLVYAEGGKVYVNPSSGSIESFEMIQLEGNKIAFKLPNGQYFCAEGGGGKEVVANRTTIGPWETFELVYLMGNQIAIKAANGQYLSVQWGDKNPVFANRTAITASETFELQWSGLFGVTTQAADRAIFTRAFKFAENENQVGEVLPGEVALYEHVSYWGKTWVFQNDVVRFTDFDGLNDQISSIVLGQQTGATLYKAVQYGLTTTAANSLEAWISTAQKSSGFLSLGDLPDQIATAQANLREDLVEDRPSLIGSQIGNDAMSSLRIWRNLPPSQVGVSFTCCLSQDYKLNADQTDQTLKEFSSYRTILQFPPEVTSVDVWATDVTSIMVDEQVYVVNEDRSVRLSPNQMQRLMITSKAEGLNTPGLKIRTNTMQSFERIVIFPDKYTHGKLAEMPNNGLWDAKDNAGNLLVDRNKFNQSQVAAVQTSIQNTLATVEYVVNSSDSYAVDRTINPKKIINPWKLNLMASDGIGTNRSSIATPTITALNQEEFTQLVTTANNQGGTLAQSIWNDVGNGISSATSSAGHAITSAVSTATSVVVGVANDVVNVITDTAGKVVNWVIDTAEKVGAFAEGLVQRIGVALEKFVEYLRFLFAWDDILETQRYLAEAIETAVNASGPMMKKVQAPLHNLFDSQRQTIAEHLGQQGQKFSKKKDAVEGKNDQPEAFEWLMSKIMSGMNSGSSLFKFSSDAKTEDQLNQFTNSLLQDCATIETSFVNGFSSLSLAIQQLIERPTKPQVLLSSFLNFMQELVDDFLTILQNLLDRFIDLIPAIMKQFLQGLKMELNIPFVSALFKQISKGQPLNALNLFTLLIAIPATITSKLIRGQTPFHNSPKLAMSEEYPFGWSVSFLIMDAIEGVMNTILDSQSEKVDLGSLGDFLEFGSLAMRFGEFLEFTFRYEGLEDEREPDGSLSVANQQLEYLCVFRILTWGVDLLTCVTLPKLLKSKDRRPGRLERARRYNGTTMIIYSLIKTIDLALTSAYVGIADETAMEEASYITPVIPEVLSWLRHPQLPYADTVLPKVLAGLDLVCVGYALLIDGLELREA